MELKSVLIGNGQSRPGVSHSITQFHQGTLLGLESCLWLVDAALMVSCRYEEMAVKDAGSKDWSRAEKYYYQAVDVFPEGTGF